MIIESYTAVDNNILQPFTSRDSAMIEAFFQTSHPKGWRCMKITYPHDALTQVEVFCTQQRKQELLAFEVIICFVLFCFVLFCFVLFCFVLFCFVLFCFVLFCFVLFCFVLFCFVLF